MSKPAASTGMNFLSRKNSLIRKRILKTLGTGVQISVGFNGHNLDDSAILAPYAGER